jgi:hypothetical protein
VRCDRSTLSAWPWVYRGEGGMAPTLAEVPDEVPVALTVTARRERSRQ